MLDESESGHSPAEFIGTGDPAEHLHQMLHHLMPTDSVGLCPNKD